MSLSPSSLRSLRVAGSVRCEHLTPVEHFAIDRSYRRYVAVMRRVAYRYYSSRADNPFDATDWLVSEAYTYVIESVIAGKRSVPTSRAQWLAVLKTIRHRYYASLHIVADGALVALLGINDDTLAHRVRLQSQRFEHSDFWGWVSRLVAIGSESCPAPAWCVEVIEAWQSMPYATYQERAEHFGLTINGWKSREHRTRELVRAGLLAEVS
jgi:hypothetical protein